MMFWVMVLPAIWLYLTLWTRIWFAPPLATYRSPLDATASLLGWFRGWVLTRLADAKAKKAQQSGGEGTGEVLCGFHGGLLFLFEFGVSTAHFLERGLGGDSLTNQSGSDHRGQPEERFKLEFPISPFFLDTFEGCSIAQSTFGRRTTLLL
jgi:hypothetical protein